ncbi:MAG: hypothetical protein GQ474_05995 [Sulfurimonas sp.]|nr:hypothetical protein [Sulfurimonas sp.]
MGFSSPFSKAVTTVNGAIGSLIGSVGGGAVLGWQQSDIGELNDALFVTLQDKKTNVTVKGRVISYSVSNQSEWANKFEGSDADSKAPRLSAILQSGVYSDHSGRLGALEGKTLINKAQTVQVWTGMQPQEISLEIEFRAFRNASQEVEQPIQALLKMMSPQLNDNVISATKALFSDLSLDGVLSTFSSSDEKANTIAKGLEGSADKLGVIPSAIAISLFNKRFSTSYRLESLNENVDEIKVDRQGNRVYQVVSLSLGSTTGIMKSDIHDGTQGGAILGAVGSFDSAFNNVSKLF